MTIALFALVWVCLVCAVVGFCVIGRQSDDAMETMRREGRWLP